MMCEDLEKKGIVGTNISRVTQAADRCHIAVCAMDDRQLDLFKQTEVGRLMIQLANRFADGRMGLRKIKLED